MTQPPREPRRIVLIKPSALGDIMNSLPVLSALRVRFPHAHISWIVNRAFEPLLRGHPHLDETIPFERSFSRHDLCANILGFARFLRDLRRRHFDLAIDMQGLFRSGLIAWATGAPRRIGPASAREGAVWFYTETVGDPTRLSHAVDRCWSVAEHLGAGHLPKTFHLPVEASARTWAQTLLRDHPRPWLALGVGSRWLTKRWPPEHFAELARRTQRQFGGTIIFIGAPDEADLARHTARMLDGPLVNVAGATSLVQLAAVLAEADVLLANDTGPLHMAVALGRPIVAPYTCTRVGRNGPYGQEHHAVEARVPCQGSYLRKCDRLECMAELTPDRLWPILRSVLETWAQQRLSA